MAYQYRVDQLQEVLAALCQRVEGIEQAVVVSLDGFVVAAHPPAESDQPGSLMHSPTIAATAANAISLGEGALERLQHGRFQRLIVESDRGAMIIYPIEQAEAALVALVGRDARLGLASLAMRGSISQLGSILSGGGREPP